MKAFRVFDQNELGKINREFLRSQFINCIGRDKVNDKLVEKVFAEVQPQTDSQGNIDYEELIQIMLNEPDPLQIPDHIKL